MQLLTDYRQWYDHKFDREGPTLERMAFTRGGMDKRAQLAMFERLGLKTPPHGLVHELAARALPFGGGAKIWRPELDCVVYHDELAHRGDGKERLKLSDALERYPHRYATIFVPPRREAVCLRHARIGRIGAWIRQTSTTDWRTNIDDVERALDRSTFTDLPIPRVLWAIDFIPSPMGLLAIDFNTAPDLDTLGESGLVTAEEVHAELIRAAEENVELLKQPP